MTTKGELRRDFRLYARECLKIQPKRGGLIPFEINGVQQRVLDAIEDCRRQGVPPHIVVLKARRMGISTLVQGLEFWDCHMNDHRTALTLAYDVPLAKELFDKSRIFYQNLPPSLRVKKKLDSQSNIRFSNTMGWLRVAVAGKRAGRGYGANTVHISELAWMEDGKATLDAVLVAVADDPSAIVIVESTPNGTGEEFYNLWELAKTPGSGWIALFFPWYEDPTYVKKPHFTHADLTDEEKALVEAYNVTLEQLAWRRYTIRTKFRGDSELFLQEYPSDDKSCFLRSGRTAFDPAAIEVVRAQGIPECANMVQMEEFNRIHPAREIEWDAVNKKPFFVNTPKARLRIYEEPIVRHEYVAGWDPSAGDPGSDYSPGCVISRMTLNVVCTWIGKAPPEVLAQIARAVATYYNRAKITWEANNHGLVFGVTIEDIYDNLYWRQTSKDSTSRAVTDKVGFLTTPKTRDFLFDNARAIVRQIGIGELHCRIHDPWLVSQMAGMVYDRKNPRGQERIEPQSVRNDDPRYKDDLLVAYCLALEGHKAYPDEPLRPLTFNERLEVMTHAKQLISEGAKPGGGVIDRLNVTAAELEELDEWAHRRKKAREKRGFGSMV